MAFKKGEGGRPRGAQNRSTLAAKEAIARFVDGNAEKVQGWLEQIAKEQGPQAAFKCWLDLVEYHVPKLARTELTGKDGADLVPKVLVLKQD